MKKPTQRELIVRYLVGRMGEWSPSYDLVKKETEHGYIGLQGDRRAQELAEEGYYDSKNYRYFIERTRIGKYAMYRVSRKEKIVYQPKPVIAGGRVLRDFTHAMP